MHNLIAETAQTTLSQYANYREKQLLAAGETEACFVSVMTISTSIAKLETIAELWLA